MKTISMTQKQGLESMPAAAQIIDRIGSRPAQVANGLIGRFRNIDGFQFTGTEQPSQFQSRRSVFIRCPQNASESSKELPQCRAPRAGATDAQSQIHTGRLRSRPLGADLLRALYEVASAAFR
jgi:hypothetical protein